MSRSNVKVAVLAIALIACGGTPDRPTVVSVRAWSASGVAERATGTIVPDGRVLTVEHVLAGARRVEVDGRVATVVRRDPELDLAELRSDVTGPPVRYGEADGDLRVLTPRGARPATLNRRVNVHFAGTPGRRPSLDLAAKIVAGDSGAPVVDREGRIVGVVYARSTRREAAYAVRVP